MSTLKLTIPHSLQAQIEALASREGVSVGEFVALTLAEKVAALTTADYLAERGQRGSREKLLAVLAKAPDVDPEAYDRL
jgi:hypothetical protein